MATAYRRRPASREEDETDASPRKTMVAPSRGGSGASATAVAAALAAALAATLAASASAGLGGLSFGLFPSPRAEVLRVMGGSWQQVDLTPHDALNAALTAVLANESYVEGHSGTAPRERQVYWALAARRSVKTICEIGFNAGHSASLWMLANPTARVVMFDLWEHAYAAQAEAFLKGPQAAALGIKNGADRLTIHKGDSRTVVRIVAGRHPSLKCDLISVDGGHEHNIAVDDIANMEALAAPGAILVVDDSNCDAHWCVDEAVDHHRRLGTVRRLFAVAEEPVIMEVDEDDEEEGEKKEDEKKDDGSLERTKEEAFFVRGVTVAQYLNVPL